MSLILFVETATPRNEYIFGTLFKAIGLEITTTTDRLAFIKSDLARLNYSPQSFDHAFELLPTTLLFENSIRAISIDCFTAGNLTAFFKTPGDFPFDIFAASFYLLSRYEEYLPYKEDVYGRFAHENSLAFKEKFLHTPLINLWLEEFKASLLKKFSHLVFTPASFRFVPTYDIDIAWSYRHKGLLRNAGGLLRSLVDHDWQTASERINVLFGNLQDPFDSYKWLDQIHRELNLLPVYFFLLAKQNKLYDKNILPFKTALRKLIKNTASKYETGIHPSWQSGDDCALLGLEIKTLQLITTRPVSKSRQHYIRMTLPYTYQWLVKEGITEDYSMGYGSINGFRASYCLPFKWYDLEREVTTELTIFPFCYMDANSFFEQHLQPAEALEEMKHYYQVTRQVNGLLITIWHNHFLGIDKLFTGWRHAYESFLRHVSA